ncbi:hypothetical protein QL285_076895 [Trifolium repens]|nr:hypothetical protein QL285_076895 [Trifolium repens]
MPLKYWDHSFTQAVYLTNRLPSNALPHFNSPHHALFQSQPDYSQIKVLGCLCFPHLRPYNRHKLQFRSSPCVYLGVSPQHKGHKCLDSQGRIYISKDVIFHELKFPYMSLFGNESVSSLTLHNSLSYPAQLHFPSQPSPTPTTTPVNNPSPLISNSHSSSSSLEPEHTSPTHFSIHVPIDAPPVVSNHNNHSMITRGKTGNLKPKAFLTEIEP